MSQSTSGLLSTFAAGLSSFESFEQSGAPYIVEPVQFGLSDVQTAEATVAIAAAMNADELSTASQVSTKPFLSAPTLAQTSIVLPFSLEAPELTASEDEEFAEDEEESFPDYSTPDSNPYIQFDALAVDWTGSSDADEVILVGCQTVKLASMDGADEISVIGSSSVSVAAMAGNDDVSVSDSGLVILDGMEGNDFLMTRDSSHVTLEGGIGDDTLSVVNAEFIAITDISGDDLITLEGVGRGRVMAGVGEDSINLLNSRSITIDGGSENDSIHGTGLQNGVLLGDMGDDLLMVSSSSQMTMRGGQGDDTIIVKQAIGMVNDIWGDEGSDRIVVDLTAGIQGEVFIQDFEDGIDRLEFKGIVNVEAVKMMSVGANTTDILVGDSRVATVFHAGASTLTSVSMI